MLSLRQIKLSRGTKILLENANATIYEKQKIGLVGENGCGKTSLFYLILGHLQADAGDYQMNTHLRISHLSQQIPDSDEKAIDFVLAGDDAYSSLLQRLKKSEAEGKDEDVLLCHDLLRQTQGYTKPALAASIMAGLGFQAYEQENSVNSFSGGWRMRLSLARCLMNPADLLLLDEPTNHLDMEAIIWLEKWLKQVSASLIVISHDREFLDAITTHTLHIENQSLNVYTGNYSAFEFLRAQKLSLQQATFEKQQAKINHLMQYVNRFRASASKAKQAQSRLKAISKMDIVAQAQSDASFSFEFYPCPKAGKPLLKCENLFAGYETGNALLKKINFSINPGDRIALLGPNGEGKSTFIKTLTGKLPLIDGELFHSPTLKIGYYAQHQLEELDNFLSPVETIQALSPDVREQTIRDFLGGFNFIGEMATNVIQHFSGGEKARLALAKLVWLKPNLLFLDEPTNHLDLNMRSAIELALQSYEGALILISHDRHLLRSSVNEFYLVFDKKVQAFNGDLDDYYQWLQDKDSGELKKPSQSSYREKKSLQNRVKKLEQLMLEYQQRLDKIEIQLGDESLYLAEKKEKLHQILQDREKTKKAFNLAEEEWLEVMEEIEG
ncbi:ABC-F family ATP-binding cassette domain-containing protein [Legionella adelaidensis]|nr:ATP-binding cassette domain-containing protein [Legionella adelaidensis]